MTDTPNDAAPVGPDGVAPAPSGDVLTAPPLPPTPSTGSPRLMRSPAHGRIAGVSAGISQYLGIDVALVRVAFVLLAFAGGVGLVLYVALYLLLPVGDGSAQPARTTRDLSFWAAIGLFVLAAILALDGAGDGGLVVGVALVAVGVAIWRRDDGGGVAARSAAWTPDVNAPTGAMATDAMGAAGVPPTRIPVRDQAPDWEAPDAPVRERSWLGGATVATALLVAATLVSLNIAGVTDLGVGAVASISLLVIGAGLLVGTWIGRARWLVIPAVLLLPVMVIGGFASEANFDLRLGGGFGQREAVPAFVMDVEPVYSLVAGDFLLDLTGIDLTDQDLDIAVDQIFGQVTIIVPKNVSIDANVTLEGGEIHFLDEAIVSGNALSQSFGKGSTTDVGAVDLTIDLVFGQVNIIQEGVNS